VACLRGRSSVAFLALRGDGLLELAQLSVSVSSIVLHVVLQRDTRARVSERRTVPSRLPGNKTLKGRGRGGSAIAAWARRGPVFLCSGPLKRKEEGAHLFLKTGIDGGTFGVAGPKELSKGSLLVALVQLQNNLATHGVSGQRRMHLGKMVRGRGRINEIKMPKKRKE